VNHATSCDDGSDDTGFQQNFPLDYNDVINDLKITVTDAWKMERNKILK